MARFQLSSLGIGVYQDSAGNGQAGAAVVVTGGTLYAASSGSTPETGLRTDQFGRAPGWLDPDTDPGTYTVSYGGNTPVTFAVGNQTLSGRAKGGSGSPEGVVTASPGAIYAQTDGATGRTLWVKNTGTGNTGWRLKRTVISHDIMLYGPECRAASALTASTSGTYGFQGDALSASTAFLLGGTTGTVIGCFWQVVWTPNNASCGIRLISADAGPTNITQIAELTGSGSATPLNDGAYVAAATMQALYDFTAGQAVGGSPKTLGFQTKGNGSVAPVIYMVRVQVLVEV